MLQQLKKEARRQHCSSSTGILPVFSWASRPFLSEALQQEGRVRVEGATRTSKWFPIVNNSDCVKINLNTQ